MSGSGNTTTPSGREDLSFSNPRPRLVPGLYIAHSYLQPDRIGECCPVDPHAPGPYVFGSEREGTAPRAHFFQIRAGEIVDGGPLTGKNLSRDQLRAEAEGDSLRIENAGETTLSCNFTDVRKGQVFIARPGDVLHLHHNCVLLVGHAPVSIPPPDPRLLPLHSFGEPDVMGITGESWRAWELRRLILAAVATGRHVFILGPTGTGKELVARAIHKMSHRCDAPFIPANGATFSSELTAYQLFGNRKDAPNVGSPFSPGFLGKAGAGVFFLDEIGEMAPALQAALLRALEGGYTRIGESHETPTECLVVCATNRAASFIKEDVLTRLGVTLTTLSLDDRREDLALIARAMLLLRARRGPECAAFAKQYVRRDSHGWEHVPVHSSLILGLLRSPLRGNAAQVAGEPAFPGRGTARHSDAGPAAERRRAPCDARRAEAYALARSRRGGVGHAPRAHRQDGRVPGHDHARPVPLAREVRPARSRGSRQEVVTGPRSATLPISGAEKSARRFPADHFRGPGAREIAHLRDESSWHGDC